MYLHEDDFPNNVQQQSCKPVQPQPKGEKAAREKEEEKEEEPKAKGEKAAREKEEEKEDEEPKAKDERVEIRVRRFLRFLR